MAAARRPCFCGCVNAPPPDDRRPQKPDTVGPGDAQSANHVFFPYCTCMHWFPIYEHSICVLEWRFKVFLCQRKCLQRIHSSVFPSFHCERIFSRGKAFVANFFATNFVIKKSSYLICGLLRIKYFNGTTMLKYIFLLFFPGHHRLRAASPWGVRALPPKREGGRGVSRKVQGIRLIWTSQINY